MHEVSELMSRNVVGKLYHIHERVGLCSVEACSVEGIVPEGQGDAALLVRQEEEKRMTKRFQMSALAREFVEVAVVSQECFEDARFTLRTWIDTCHLTRTTPEPHPIHISASNGPLQRLQRQQARSQIPLQAHVTQPKRHPKPLLYIYMGPSWAVAKTSKTKGALPNPTPRSCHPTQTTPEATPIHIWARNGPFLRPQRQEARSQNPLQGRVT